MQLHSLLYGGFCTQEAILKKLFCLSNLLVLFCLCNRINLSKWEDIVKKQLEEVQQNGPPGTLTEKKLDQLKIPGSKLQERSLSFVRYNCSGILEMGQT